MATVTKTIGSASRDYSTLTAWEADLDNDTPYDAGDDAVGECYDDSDFDMNGDFTLDGGGTLGLNSVRLSVAAGERHDGTAGTGVRIYTSTSTNFRFKVMPINTDKYSLIIEWLELDGSDASTSTQLVTGNNQISSSYATLLRNCIIHNERKRMVQSTTKEIRVQNSIFYKCGASATATIPVYLRCGYAGGGFYNNTMHYLTSSTTSAWAYLRFFFATQNTSETRIINNLATKVFLPNSSSIKEYGFYAGGAKTPYSDTDRYKNNASEDTSSIDIMLEGTVGSSACITGVSPDNIYVSTTVGSEDLRLKDNTEILGAGNDEGNSNNVDIDIRGYDRDNADHWDIGAYQYVRGGDPLGVGASFAMFVD